MKAKLMFVGLLLATSTTNAVDYNAADFRPFDYGKAMEQAEKLKAMRQEREYREMQMRQQQELHEQKLRQQQSQPTRKACMKDCREAGYKYSECRAECPPDRDSKFNGNINNLSDLTKYCYETYNGDPSTCMGRHGWKWNGDAWSRSSRN